MNIQIGKPHIIQGLGRRDHQEDAFCPPPEQLDSSSKAFAVCDGMGGHEYGEVASRLAAEGLVNGYDAYMQAELSEEHFMDLFQSVLQSLEKDPHAMKGSKHMGTTMTFVSLTSQGLLAAHLGDSTIFVIRPSRITEFVYRSADHSQVYRLVQLHQLTPVQALTYQYRNVLDKAVVPFEYHNPEVCLITDLLPGDYVFMCTDGVTENLTDEMIRFIFASYRTIDEITELIHLHCSLSSDNHTALIIPIIGVEESNGSDTIEPDSVLDGMKPLDNPVDWEDYYCKDAENIRPQTMGVATNPTYGNRFVQNEQPDMDDPQVNSQVPEESGTDLDLLSESVPKESKSTDSQQVPMSKLIEQVDYSLLHEREYKNDNLLEMTKGMYK